MDRETWNTKYTSPEGATRIVGMHTITPEDIRIHKEREKRLLEKYGIL